MYIYKGLKAENCLSTINVYSKGLKLPIIILIFNLVEKFCGKFERGSTSESNAGTCHSFKSKFSCRDAGRLLIWCWALNLGHSNHEAGLENALVEHKQNDVSEHDAMEESALLSLSLAKKKKTQEKRRMTNTEFFSSQQQQPDRVSVFSLSLTNLGKILSSKYLLMSALRQCWGCCGGAGALPPQQQQKESCCRIRKREKTFCFIIKL